MGQAPSDDPFYTVTGETIYGTYIPSDTSSSGGSSGGSAPGTGPGSVVAETSGGITINLLFDAAAMAAPASFRAGIAQAAAILASTISDKITVNLNIDYSGTGGGAAAGPDSGLFENYSTIRSDLVNGATPGDGTFNALPTGSSIQGQSYCRGLERAAEAVGLSRRQRHHDRRRQRDVCHRHQSEPSGRRGPA